MKKSVSILLVLLLMLCVGAAPALAEAAQAITAEGTATVTVTPDMASFTAGVSTQGASLVDVQGANAADMQAVLDALKEQGVAEEDLQTSYYSISPMYDYSDDSDGRTVSGYVVSNTVQVTVRDLKLLPTLLDAAVAAGANETYGVDFSSTQSSDAYDQALQAAVSDAVRKASLMAQALGREAGAVISLTEGEDTYYTRDSGMSIALSSSSSTPIQSGTLSVSANVTAVVEMN